MDDFIAFVSPYGQEGGDELTSLPYTYTVGELADRLMRYGRRPRPAPYRAALPGVTGSGRHPLFRMRSSRP